MATPSKPRKRDPDRAATTPQGKLLDEMLKKYNLSRRELAAQIGSCMSGSVFHNFNFKERHTPKGETFQKIAEALNTLTGLEIKSADLKPSICSDAELLASNYYTLLRQTGSAVAVVVPGNWDLSMWWRN